MTPRSVNALLLHIRPGPTLHVLGTLLGGVALLALVPLGLAAATGEWSVAAAYLGACGGLGAAWWLGTRFPAPEEIHPSEGFVVACLAFVLAPLAMSLPMSLAAPTFMDALFEAVSGATTTGLSTLATVEGTTPVFRFARAYMQWYGGLGIVILALAVMVRPGRAAKGLAVTESAEAGIIGGVRAHALRALAVYGALSGVFVLAVWASGAGQVRFFDALTYVLAAVSTGGYSPLPGSLSGIGPVVVQAMVMLACLAGALPLNLFDPRDAGTASRRIVRTQLLLLLLLCLAVAALLAWFLRAQGLAWPEALRHGTLLGVSAQSTAGFSTLAVAELAPGAKLVLIVSMLVGGATGSTAGGFKLLRLLIACKLAVSMARRACLPPHAMDRLTVGGTTVDEGRQREALAVILLYVAALGGSWLPFLLHGYDPLDSLFEVASALATCGLSTGVTAAELPGALKGVLCADMLLGRLEIVAWIVFFYPRSWIGRRL